MRSIPCRICNQCGLHHDISVKICGCGADLMGIPVLLVKEEIPPERRGMIREELPVYVQKCSACGAQNFTVDPGKPARICCNCHKSRIAMVTPVLFKDEPEDGVNQPEEAARASAEADEFKDTDDDEADDVFQWQSILDGIQSAERSVEAPVEAKEKEFTLTAVRYGSMTLTLLPNQQDLPFLLGRSAGLKEFLSQDLRVGNEHCYLAYRNGDWFVIDNHSANGTAVNGQFLDINGECILRDGDELVLGHHPDSMAFRIGIR